jgi:hypothetical protein
MVEMARRGSERSSSGMDPPRRFRSLATKRPSPSIQRRHIVPEAAARPCTVPYGGNSKAQGERRPSACGARKMGLKGFSGAKNGRMEIGNRPPHHQQVLAEEVHEHGDPSTPTTDRKAGRPLGLVRPKTRFLRASHTSGRQRGVHNILKWAVAVALRAAYWLVAQSVCFPKTNGRIRQQAAGSRGYGDKSENKEGKKEVNPSTTTTNGSQAAAFRRRLRHVRQGCRRGA